MEFGQLKKILRAKRGYIQTWTSRKKIDSTLPSDEAHVLLIVDDEGHLQCQLFVVYKRGFIKEGGFSHDERVLFSHSKFDGLTKVL